MSCIPGAVKEITPSTLKPAASGEVNRLDSCTDANGFIRNKYFNSGGISVCRLGNLGVRECISLNLLTVVSEEHKLICLAAVSVKVELNVHKGVPVSVIYYGHIG